MNWVDLVIIVMVILAALNGRRVGAVRQVAGYVGLGAGFVVGTIIAPSLSTTLTHAAWRPLVALAVVLVATVIGGRLGRLLGDVVAESMRALHLGLVDSLGGVLVGVLGTLVGCWLIAGLLASTAWGSLAAEIQNSSVLAAINKVMPPVPTFEAKVQSLFRDADFPSIFSSIVAPTLPATVSPRDLGPVVTSLAAPSGVVKVLASGACSRIQQGTAFFVSSRDAVTNAHVVAGEPRITVNGAPALVVLYDPNNDIAILRVGSGAHVPLTFFSGAVATGARARVIGFPLDSTRTSAPGYVEGAITAQGRDIYDRNLLTRTYEVIETNVQPGNSGSPVVVDGDVAGVIESKSLSQASTAYAIPDGVVERDLAHAGTRAVSTSGCLP
ncbi:MAG: MarP family serine protease [Acidimicrobiales bacterium]